MANPSTANEPSMEEILASIRQIISEDGDEPPARSASASTGAAGSRRDPAEQDGPADPEIATRSQSAAKRPEARGQSPSEARQPQSRAPASPAPAPSSQAAPHASQQPSQGQASSGQASGQASPSASPASTQSTSAAPASEPRKAPEPAAASPSQSAGAAAANPGSAQQGRQPMPAQRAISQTEERNLLSERSNAAVSGAFGTLTHTILAQHARTLDDLVAEMLRPMLKEWLDDNLPPLVERLVKEEIERVSRGRR